MISCLATVINVGYALGKFASNRFESMIDAAARILIPRSSFRRAVYARLATSWPLRVWRIASSMRDDVFHLFTEIP